MLKSKLGILRLIGHLEGISFLLLLGVCMPLKYVWENEVLMLPVGLAHGILFISFLLMVFVVAQAEKQDLKFIFFSAVASIMPFGTFIADKKIYKPLVQ